MNESPENLMIRKDRVKKNGVKKDFITDILEDGQVTDYDITPKDVGERTGDSRKIVKSKVNRIFDDRPRILIESVEQLN